MAPADTTVGLNSVTGLPTDTAIDLVVDRVDSNGNLTPAKREFIKGIVAGSTLTSVTRGIGNSTAQAHANSAVVEMVWTSDTHNDMASALLTSHNQDGTLKTGSVTNSALASSAVDSTKLATGAVVTASITDANITPAKWTNPYKFGAFMLSIQSVSASVWTKAQINTKEFDTNTNFDATTNYRYTVPVNGFYQISAQLALTTAGGGSGTTAQAALYKNGSPLVYSSIFPLSGSGTAIPIASIVRLIQLNAGDYLELFGNIADPTRQFNGGYGGTYMTGYLVSQT